jgi:hypothetical protein
MLKTFDPFIKILLLSALFLSSSLLFAAQNTDKSILSYKGQLFGENEKELCQSESQEVALRMEELGYRVFDHTCLKSVFGKQYLVAVNYEYDVMNTIEKIESTLSSRQKCEQVKAQTMIDFSKMSAEIIAAFCQENSSTQVELIVDYRKNDDYIRAYNHGGISTSFDECLLKKESLERVLKNNQVTTLVSYCSENSFKVHMHYTLETQHSLETIRGQKVESRSSCEVNDQLLLSNFENNDLKGLKTFCTKIGDQLYKSVLYLDKFFSKVREFNGFSKSDLAQCESSLEDAAEKLREDGHAPLYKYCQESKESFIPVIHYLEVSSI